MFGFPRSSSTLVGLCCYILISRQYLASYTRRPRQKSCHSYSPVQGPLLKVTWISLTSKFISPMTLRPPLLRGTMRVAQYHLRERCLAFTADGWATTSVTHTRCISTTPLGTAHLGPGCVHGLSPVACRGLQALCRARSFLQCVSPFPTSASSATTTVAMTSASCVSL